MTGMWLNVGSGGHPAPAPWWNVDCYDWQKYGTPPDQIVAAGQPLPYPDGSCDRIYCGHVIEHVPWADVPAFLADLHRLLTDDGTLLVAGPDVNAALRLWRNGELPGTLLAAIMEHADDLEWPEQRHHWNCDEERVRGALEAAGFTVTRATPAEAQGDRWPLINWTDWQFAVWAVKP